MAANLWFFCALSTSILWGLGYTLTEKLLRMGMPTTFMMITQSLFYLPLCIAFSIALRQFRPGWNFLMGNREALLISIGLAVCMVIAQFLILTSITMKNATLASLVEITYPIFVAGFSWMIFKEMQLGWTSALGGILILAGVSLIYLKN